MGASPATGAYSVAILAQAEPCAKWLCVVQSAKAVPRSQAHPDTQEIMSGRWERRMAREASIERAEEED